MENLIKLNSNIELINFGKEIKAKCVEANTFENPVYLSNEQNGHSNWNTDPLIKTYSRTENGMILPRGFMRELIALCHESSVQFELVDERISVPCQYPDSLKEISLRPYQQRCISAAMRYDQGILVAPTGAGKTLLALEIIRARGQKSLIIVHRKELLKQWVDIIASRLGLTAGVIGEGSFELGNEVTVGMVQTLSSCADKTKKIVHGFGTVVLDEAHHAPAATFFDVIAQFPAKYRYGVSATPTRRDSLEKLIFFGLGPILEEVTRREVENVGAVVPAKIYVIKTRFKPEECNSWHEYLSMLSANGQRNDLIAKMVQTLNKPTLVLSDRVSHIELISEFLEKRKVEYVMAHGSLKDRDDIMQRMRESKVTVATVGLLGEGIDIAHWEAVILASPFSSEVKLIQAIGRAVRSSPGKREAVIFDLKDDCGFAGASFKKRFEIYRKHGIKVKFIN
jgi:superfamily II DNA or RNA helicase